jgi:hypothetical protein
MARLGYMKIVVHQSEQRLGRIFVLVVNWGLFCEGFDGMAVGL